VGPSRAVPEVLVPRYLRLPVRGRLGADGSELAPLVAEDVAAAAKLFAAEGVESVAVCLFNSFLDGAHERAAGASSARHGAGQWVSLSSEVMPTMGEYERGSTAVVNAYIAPKVTSYLARSTASCASSACRARCCCCRATAAPSRSSRSRRGR
jgi:N-methylhydantoinase A